MLVGRKKETELLNMVLKDDNSHFVAVYGRTFLVQSDEYTTGQYMDRTGI